MIGYEEARSYHCLAYQTSIALAHQIMPGRYLLEDTEASVDEVKEIVGDSVCVNTREKDGLALRYYLDRERAQFYSVLTLGRRAHIIRLSTRPH